MIYDNSFEWITTQGWSFLPLDNYGGGAAEAKFRPLEVNVVDYDLAWAQYCTYPVQHCPAPTGGHCALVSTTDV